MTIGVQTDVISQEQDVWYTLKSVLIPSMYVCNVRDGVTEEPLDMSYDLTSSVALAATFTDEADARALGIDIGQVELIRTTRTKIVTQVTDTLEVL